MMMNYMNYPCKYMSRISYLHFHIKSFVTNEILAALIKVTLHYFYEILIYTPIYVNNFLCKSISSFF